MLRCTGTASLPHAPAFFSPGARGLSWGVCFSPGRGPGISGISEKEIELIQKLNAFRAAVRQAGQDYSPSGIANYCYELTKQYNQFYHDYSILGEQDEHLRQFRLVLSEAVSKVLRLGMGLLGIEMPERM